jgi:uncharacterized membrane protein YsdA (DUF1294 family)
MSSFVNKLSTFFAIVVACLLVAALMVVIWSIRSETSSVSILLVVYLSWTLVASVFCSALYYVDKRQAIHDNRRISEKQLHLIELAGGWPGAVIARQVFRHKTRKLAYRLRFWLIVVVHVLLIIMMYLQNV